MINKVEPKIVLAVASLGIPTIKFVSSLVQTSLQNPFSRFCIMDGCLLPHIRNAIIKRIYDNDPDFTHIMFIDDDMCHFTHEDIVKLVDADKPIISALMMMRSLPYKVVQSFDPEEPVEDYVRQEKIVQVKSTGFGFTLLKKEVLDAVMEYTKGDPIWFTTDRHEREEFEAEIEDFVRQERDDLDSEPERLRNLLREAIIMGQQSNVGTLITGEDISFCTQAKKFGFESWIHCGVMVGHLGKHVFDAREALNVK